MRKSVFISVVIPQIVLLLISITWITFFPKDNVIKFFKLDILHITLGIVIGFLLAFAGYLFYLFAKKTKIFYATVELFEDMLSPNFIETTVIDAILISIISGFCEEVFFRGLLAQKIGIIFSSIAFGLLHFPGVKFWIYGVWATCSGMLLCWLLNFTGSLFPPIATHAINNFIGLVLLINLAKERSSRKQ